MKNFSTYSSPEFIIVVGSRKFKWEGLVAHMGGREMHIRFCDKP
jgi:hypothetical protein